MQGQASLEETRTKWNKISWITSSNVQRMVTTGQSEGETDRCLWIGMGKDEGNRWRRMTKFGASKRREMGIIKRRNGGVYRTSLDDEKTVGA